MIRASALLAVLLVAGAQGNVFRRLIHDNRIVGGVDVVLGEYPSQLSLQFYGSHKCGASILNANWALTAAHCVDGSSPVGHTLLAGSVDLGSEGTQHTVAEMVVHSGYNPSNSYANDIAVLKVSTPFNIDGTNVKPVALPASGQNPPVGSIATVIGWGLTTEGGVIAEILQKVDNNIVDQDVCNNAYVGIGLPVHSTHICAAVPGGNKGACNGDSGGPLFVNGITVGIVSWSLGCVRQGYPTVYTRVSSYRDWITQQTGA